ncbi:MULTISPECIES: 23S rRNA (adenine(2503)-C(2))-methyltransferase RlmN [Clostridiaceae]|nr:23S rRNA (adenine(2503)-C(2))-methyltransferase RlmN [Clostridium facile]
MIDIKSLTYQQLAQVMEQKGQPNFRTKQIFEWLHKRNVSDFGQMTNLSAQLREELSAEFYLNCLKIKKKLVSRIDDTVKYLYELQDGECVESVFMKYQYGNSICISTQVGCRMGCSFCASTKAGFVRCLTPSEMLEQVYRTEQDTGQKISNIVLMGIGEPLDNFENVMAFLELISHPSGRNLGQRHITLSTCGLVPRIYELADRKLQITLSISLHAPNNTMRSKTMPVNLKYPIEELLEACCYYIQQTNRRISFEYALIKGVNDREQDANELAARLKPLLCHVNLIPVNEIKERDYQASKKQNVIRFSRLLEQSGINVTVRRTLGQDINAACGQLRRDNRS